MRLANCAEKLLYDASPSPADADALAVGGVCTEELV